MAVVTKASAAAKFETNDKPTQQDFEDLIDSAVFIPSAGATGVIEVESTASATNRAIGALGIVMLAVATTASAQGHLGGEAVGIQVFSAATTASAQGHLDITTGAVGTQLLAASTTASAQGHLGAGTVGIQVLSAATTASAQSHVGLDKSIIQIAQTQTGAVATGTTQIPVDDTIPQNTEGDEYMTLAFTPRSSSSRLRIEVIAQVGSGSSQLFMTAALFRDSIADALAVITNIQVSTTATLLTFSHNMASPGTSSTTFKIRIGGGAAGTTTFNGNSGSRLFGGVMASSITITEYLP